MEHAVMQRITFGRVQTNRATLKKYLDLFRKNKQGGESFISPRPQPGKYQEYYYALIKFPEETRNARYFTALKNFKPLSEVEYNDELSRVQFYWEA
jgi:hypothetical protein